MSDPQVRALVTGGSGALGAAICRRLGAAGHLVYVHANRNESAAQEVVREIRDAGGEARAVAFDVTDTDGKVQNWMIECGSPNIMLRRGFTKRSLEVGTEITVQGYQAKNGTLRANGSSITFKDGKKLFVGGSNPDIPTDQR